MVTSLLSSRRRWLAATLLAAGLAGCGFELRQPVKLPYQRVALTGFARHSEMPEALRLALPSGTRIVDSPAQAEVVLAVLEDKLDRTVAASTSAGQVREFRLRVLLKFRLTRPDGAVLLGDTELEQSRDLSYTETAALAKQTEEATLLHDMRADMARQMLRMLSASANAVPKLPAPSASAASAPTDAASAAEPAFVPAPSGHWGSAPASAPN